MVPLPEEVALTEENSHPTNGFEVAIGSIERREFVLGCREFGVPTFHVLEERSSLVNLDEILGHPPTVGPMDVSSILLQEPGKESVRHVTLAQGHHIGVVVVRRNLR